MCLQNSLELKFDIKWSFGTYAAEMKGIRNMKHFVTVQSGLSTDLKRKKCV